MSFEKILSVFLLVLSPVVILGNYARCPAASIEVEKVAEAMYKHKNEINEGQEDVQNLLDEVFSLITVARSCSDFKMLVPTAESGHYTIDPDDEGNLSPFKVYCNMTDWDGVGVTVISHDSESRTLVDGYERAGSYSRDIHYTGASLSQLASLTRVSSYCEQFISYECYGSMMLGQNDAWWVSRDSTKMTYWGGASPDSGKCACGMNNSCDKPFYICNCDINDGVWRNDSGFLSDKTHLPVKQLRFGDTSVDRNVVGLDEKGYHTLGKLKCRGIA